LLRIEILLVTVAREGAGEMRKKEVQVLKRGRERKGGAEVGYSFGKGKLRVNSERRPKWDTAGGKGMPLAEYTVFRLCGECQGGGREEQNP